MTQKRAIRRVFKKLNKMTKEEWDIEFDKYENDPFVNMLVKIGACDLWLEPEGPAIRGPGSPL